MCRHRKTSRHRQGVSPALHSVSATPTRLFVCRYFGPCGGPSCSTSGPTPTVPGRWDQNSRQKLCGTRKSSTHTHTTVVASPVCNGAVCVGQTSDFCSFCFQVINQVGAFSLRATLNCEEFANQHSSTAHFDPKSFVGLAVICVLPASLRAIPHTLPSLPLQWRPAGESICCEIYSTGRAKYVCQGNHASYTRL